MTSEKFDALVYDVFNRCFDTLITKAKEYATLDRLHNFKIAADLQGCTPITALAGMMAKHTVSVYDLIQKNEQGYAISRDMWFEKIGDSINYLILLSALIQEKEEDDFRKSEALAEEYEAEE